MALTRVVGRLPDRALHRAAQAAGLGLHLAARRRRRLVRANLERVTRWLDEEGMASPRVARAARDPRALDALVRSAFGHYVRAYLEVLLAPSRRAGDVLARIHLETPETVADAFGPSRAGAGRMFVALHLGSLEFPALYAVAHGRRDITAPMETLADPSIQSFMERARSASGVRVVPVRGSGRLLADALARGEAVAIVADRPIASAGRPVTLFGAPAPLPVGPALLALGSGARVYVVAVRRTGYGTYAARVLPLEVPTEGTARERLAAFMAREARLFETVIADAPEQWWTVFFPIWEERGSTRLADARPRVGATDVPTSPDDDVRSARVAQASMR